MVYIKFTSDSGEYLI